jgi:hypothetical protein
MCISSQSRRGRLRSGGFTALELLMGMALTVFLAVGVAPLVLSLQRASVLATDRAVAVAQGRVAVARLERDLRLAASGDSEFEMEGAILEATAKQVVFLGRSGATTGSCLIEWEIAGSSLMRRWGPCPNSLPAVFAHSLYSDNKSMLESLSSDSHFSYVVKGVSASGPISSSDLGWVEAVVFLAGGRDSAGEWRTLASTTARVGR